MAKYDEDNYGPAVPRERTPIDDWEERDREAEEKRKGRPIKKPPKPPRKKKRQGRKDVEELEMAMAGPAQGNPMPSPKPPAWPTRPDGSRRLAKKGGVIRGYSSGKRVKASGKPRGVGLAKGIRKAKMVKMKG